MNINTRSLDELIHIDAKFSPTQSNIETAIENNQFSLYYQPLIDLPKGELVGFEGLLRWTHPEFGMTLPDVFIPIAEETGQINQLTNLAIDTGFKFIEALNPELSFSINISTKSMTDDHLIEALDHSCHEFNIDPHRVVLEFTGSVDMETPTHAEGVLKQLKVNGFRLGIDDTGTGPSMSPSATTHFSELKIDRSLIASMALSSTSRKSIVATIELADSLGIATCAVGIENNLEAIGLRELGCQFGQGNYFAKPMDQEDTLIWLENWNKNLGDPI